MTNPLLDVDALPAFSVIRPDHVEPAIDQVLADNRAQIEALCALNEVDYENFAAVLEQIGDRLAKTRGSSRQHDFHAEQHEHHQDQHAD